MCRHGHSWCYVFILQQGLQIRRYPHGLIPQAPLPVLASHPPVKRASPSYSRRRRRRRRSFLQNPKATAMVQPQGAAAHLPLVLQPVQVRRALGPDDVPRAFEVVKKEWIPRSNRVPEVENIYYKFVKKRDETGDYEADLVKRQVLNGCNYVGNKRWEMYYYLPASIRYDGLLKRLSNELQGLEYQLRHRIADFNTFMPDNPFEYPDHFTRYPKLLRSEEGVEKEVCLEEEVE